MANVHEMFGLGEQHEAPVGASFAPSAWIGPCKAAFVYMVLTRVNVNQMLTDHAAGLTTALEDPDEGADNQPFSETLVEPMLSSRAGESDWWRYYYLTSDDAQPLCRLCDKEDPTVIGKRRIRKRPMIQWRLEMPIADVLTLTEDAKSKFESDVWSTEVEIKAMTKNSKDWFRWHGLVLPSIVSAYAQLVGVNGVEELDLSEFMVPEDEFIVTDQVQAKLIGNTDIGYEGSVLQVRRKLLWSQYGEDNYKASNPDDTESEGLKAALTVAVSNWEKPVYCRVVNVPSPRLDDMYDSPGGGARRRRRVPVITHFYPNEAAAKKAAEAEQAGRFGDESAAPVASKNENGPAVPVEWTKTDDGPSAWVATVRIIKEEIGSVPKPVIPGKLEKMKDRLANEYLVTPQDVMDWWDHV